MQDPAVFDRAAAMKRVDADLELFQELVEIFTAEHKAQLSEIGTAIQKERCVQCQS